MSAVIGLTEEGNRLLVADSARFGGLYILGKPRVSKSWLIINLILQDIETGHGVFFLDPHGDAIDYLLHCPPVLPRLLVLRPDDPHFTFGVNPLECSNIEDAALRNDTYTKAKAVFHNAFWFFGGVAPYAGDDNVYYGPYFQGFLLDSCEAYLNRYGEGALVVLSLICQALEPNLWGDVVSVAEKEDLKWGETKEEWERRHYAGYNSLCLPSLNGKAPLEVILALERLGDIIRWINVERDLAKYCWVAYDKNAYEGCRRVMREIEGKPKNFRLHEEILIKIDPGEVFGAWVLEEPRRWSSKRTDLKGLEYLRNEAAKEPSRRDRLYALCRGSKSAAAYLERRALDIAHYGRDIADLTFPEPALAGTTRSQVTEVVDWLVSAIQRAQEKEETKKEQAQFRDQEQYLRKWQKEADGGIPYDKVGLPAVISPRVLARGELEAAKDACFRELTTGDESEWDAKGVLKVLTDLVHFCECLARPENQFMVPSGRYVEKEVNTRTEADMVNEAVRELVGLPKYTAYAKVLHWTGRIQALEVPEACWNLE